MKSALIVNYGRFGIMQRQNYDADARLIMLYLGNLGLDARITTQLPLPAEVERCDGLIFITRGELNNARWYKRQFPEKIIILLTGLVDEGDDEGGVIPVWKGGGKRFEEIRTHFDQG